MKKNIIKESIMDELCLQVETRGHGNFWLRDTNTFMEFDADVWISEGNVMCSVSSDDKVGSQLCNSKEFEDVCASAVLDEYPEAIPGFDEYVDEVGDYKEAIEDLKCSLSANADTYTKYNARVNQNIKDSGDAASLRFNESKTNKNMKKNAVKINENTLRRIVAESVKKVLKEDSNYEMINLADAYKNGDSEEYIAQLCELGQESKLKVEKITGISVDEILKHWYAFHKAMIAIKNKYRELLSTDNNDGGYYDWH